MMANDSPSTNRDFFLLTLRQQSNISRLSQNLVQTSSIVFSDILITVISPYINLQLLAIFSAVSNLSPVSIHIFILALSRSAIVSGTQNYNLSSTAEEPIRNRPLSNTSVSFAYNIYIYIYILNSAYLLSLSPRLLQLFSNAVNSSSDIILVAIRRQRNPILENSSNCYSMYSRYGYSGPSLAFIILSAPFTNSLITPLSLTIALIRLRSLSNSNNINISTLFGLPYMMNVYSLALAPLNQQPRWAAASTRVISSGEGP